MDSRQRIIQAAGRLKMASTVLMWGVPACLALFWGSMNLVTSFRQEMPFAILMETDPSLPIPALTLFLGFLVSMLPGGVIMYTLAKLRGLFGLYRQGLIFGQAHVACFRAMGWSLIWLGAAQVVFEPLMGLVVSMNNPPGRHMLRLGLESDDVLAVFMGLVVITVAWVMDEARKIQEEQELII